MRVCECVFWLRWELGHVSGLEAAAAPARSAGVSVNKIKRPPTRLCETATAALSALTGEEADQWSSFGLARGVGGVRVRKKICDM